MPESLRVIAFAVPDGSRAGLALEDRLVFAPDDPTDAAAEIELEADAATVRSGERTLRATLRGTAEADLRGGQLEGEDDTGAIAGTVPAPDSGESLRLAVAVFPGARMFGLAARRPRRAGGHDRDELTALVVEADAARAVEDPRLSVTLDARDVPRRVGLELWLATEIEDEDGAERYEPPRRAAGEVSGPPVGFDVAGLAAAAHPVRWRSRGDDGFGWFVLVHGR